MSGVDMKPIHKSRGCILETAKDVALARDLIFNVWDGGEDRGRARRHARFARKGVLDVDQLWRAAIEVLMPWSRGLLPVSVPVPVPVTVPVSPCLPRANANARVTVAQ